ncbi:MAG: hypothetical protein WC532_05390 [Candidatus Omnitrophota bacterium]
MTKRREDETVVIYDNNGKRRKIKRPETARICFTELRLSDARAHAKKFGRLGIGFKRFFVFNLLGAPVVYFHPQRANWFFPPYFDWFKKIGKEAYFSCFLKKMGEKDRKDRTWKYKFFDESEWRVVYSPEIKEKLVSMGRTDVCSGFKESGDKEFKRLERYLEKTGIKERPSYLIPINPSRWFAMIIYPSLAVKVIAERDPDIRRIINKLKSGRESVDGMEATISKDWPSGVSSVGAIGKAKSASLEDFNLPIQIDLDACRNF